MAGEWYDPAGTVAAVLAILRLEDGDIDEARIASLVPVAAERIEAFLDRVDPIPGPPPSPALQEALEEVTVDLYRLPTGGAAELAGLAVPVAALVYDPISRVRALLLPAKQRFGVG